MEMHRLNIVLIVVGMVQLRMCLVIGRRVLVILTFDRVLIVFGAVMEIFVRVTFAMMGRDVHRVFV